MTGPLPELSEPSGPTRLPFYRRFGIKVVVAFMALMLTALSASIFMSIQIASNGFERVVRQEFQSTLNFSESYLDSLGRNWSNWVQHLTVEEYDAGLGDIVRARDREALEEYFDRQLSASFSAEAVVLDVDGRVIYRSNDPGTFGGSLKHVEIVRSVLAEGDVGVAIVNDLNRLVLYAAGPIYFDDGLAGVLLVGSTMDNAFVNNIKGTTGVELAVVRDRAVMGSTIKDDSGQFIGDLPIPYLEYQMMLSRTGQVLEARFLGQRYFVAAQKLEMMDGNTPGSMFLAVPSKGLDETEAEIYRKFLYLMLGVSILTLVIGVAVSHWLSSRLTRLSKKANAIAEGKIDTKFHRVTNDEFGVLTTSFNSMQDSIRNKNAELRANSENLEKLVDERTRELNETTNELKVILSTTSQGYWRIDNDARTVEVNPRMAEILGISPDQAIGTYVDAYLSDEQKEFHRNKLEKRKTGVSESYELILTSATGKETPCIFNATPLYDAFGKKGGSFALVSDITEYKANQLALEMSTQEAEKANLAKSEFLSSMSHELRTPMNAIMGFGQMLQYNPKEPLTKTQNASVELILKGGQHLLELINDVLDLAQIEARKIEFSIETIAVEVVIGDCLSLVDDMAERRKIEITIGDIDKDLPRVWADFTRLKQVLLNLMSNAIKYNRDGGAVTVNFEKITEDLGRIAVTDTGEGIPKDRQNELFKAFSRLGAENSEVEGTGIGLVVCKDLIEMMDGKIGFESEEGKGSTFWIELPLAADHSGEVEQEDLVDATRTEEGLQDISGTMLYIEDNPSNLTLMDMIVSHIDGLSMLSAHTAELGIEIARSSLPDVIILDINLPGMDGFKALKKLQTLDETKDIPVLALSAAATKNDIEKGMSAGFLRYLTKPMQIVEVTDAIRNALDGGPQ